jgi:hypothetical protein
MLNLTSGPIIAAMAPSACLDRHVALRSTRATRAAHSPTVAVRLIAPAQ